VVRERYGTGRKLGFCSSNILSTNSDMFPQRVFARKSQRIPPKLVEQDVNRMEEDTLTMVATIEEPAAYNLITILATYIWRQDLYFVFPYVETNLYHLLRENRNANGLSTTLVSIRFPNTGCGSRCSALVER
jgi:hypothetical protein